MAVDFPQIGRQRLYKVAQKIYRLLGIYPNQDVGSKYVRTDQLRNSRKLEKLDNGYQVRNDPVDPRGVHYGTYVRGDAHGIGQTAYHKKRWYSLDNIINFSMKDLPQEVLQDLSIAAARRAREAQA